MPLYPSQPAPDFQLPDLKGRLHCLSSQRGRIAVLNFWSPECTWSQRANLALAALSQQWGERAALISIASNDSESPVQIAQAAAEQGLPLVLLDPHQVVADLYEAEVTPHLFVIDAEGILAYVGAFDDVTFRKRTPGRDHLRLAVEALLAGCPVEVTSTPAYGCSIVRRYEPSN